MACGTLWVWPESPVERLNQLPARNHNHLQVIVKNDMLAVASRSARPIPELVSCDKSNG